MRVGIIDADLIYKKRHRFPNLACMKIGGYYKGQGDIVELITIYDATTYSVYDKIFISKVFTDTQVPEELLKLKNVEYGGTGFFYDKATPLPGYIEHHKPDYNLYSDWINNKIESGDRRKSFEYYLDYSIGFTTRGCFRGCEFCVNKNYKYVSKHSDIDEFIDLDRKYICLLDDNILGYPKWKDILKKLQETDKPFQYKQGMDERILTKEKCEVLTSSKYRGDFIFAFDDIKDKDIIIKKLKLWRSYTSRITKLYVFCGFDRQNKWDDEFWRRDIKDTFERIKILMQHNCLPYIMRYNRYEDSPYKGIYITLARWCNQPSIFKKKSFKEFCIANQNVKSLKVCASMRYMNQLQKNCPEIAEEYFNLKYTEQSIYDKIGDEC